MTAERADQSPIRVVIADDQELIRAGFRMVLHTQPDMLVVAEAGSGDEAVACVAGQDVDLVLMDIRMPGMDGLTACRQIGALPDPPKVMVLTTFGHDENAIAALDVGADGFLVKDTSPEDLLRAMRRVVAGHRVLRPSDQAAELYPDAATTAVKPAAVDQPATREPASVVVDLTDDLTDRERDVLHAIGTGQNNAEIAAELCIAASTVKTHINRIMAKTGARDRVHLVLMAQHSQPSKS